MALRLLISFLVSTALFAQSTPLLLQNADEMVGSKQNNTYILNGNVHLVHDSLEVWARKALWNTQSQEISLRGAVRFSHPSGTLRADQGFYNTKAKTARGYGTVSLLDSAGMYFLFGDTMIYQREAHLADIRHNSHMILVDTNSKDEDSLHLYAKNALFYTQKERAEAFDSVRILNKDFEIHCDSAWIDNQKGLLQLWGNPVVYAYGYKITGKQIEGKLNNKKLEEMRIVSQAKALRNPQVKADSSETHLTEIEGDTLLAQFSKGKISRLIASTATRGWFWEKSKPDYRNRGSGDKMVLEFADGSPEKATLTGTARTLFYYFNKKDLVGSNEAAGDTLIMHFAGEELSKINIIGNRASGVFSGEKATKKDAAP